MNNYQIRYIYRLRNNWWKLWRSTVKKAIPETPLNPEIVEDEQEFLIIMIIIRRRRGTTKERRGPIPWPPEYEGAGSFVNA